MKRTQKWILLGMIFLVYGCTKEESKVSVDNSVVEGTRSVVNATGDALRNVVKGVNDAVYGGQK